VRPRPSREGHGRAARFRPRGPFL